MGGARPESVERRIPYQTVLHNTEQLDLARRDISPNACRHSHGLEPGEYSPVTGGEINRRWLSNVLKEDKLTPDLGFLRKGVIEYCGSSQRLC